MGKPVAIEARSKEWEAAAVGSNETTAVIPVREGDCVVGVLIEPLRAAAASTSSTVSVGDSDNDDGYATTSNWDPEAATLGVPIIGTGDYGATVPGRFYTAAGSIDVKYTAAGATGAKPKARITAFVMRLWPT